MSKTNFNVDAAVSAAEKMEMALREHTGTTLSESEICATMNCVNAYGNDKEDQGMMLGFLLGATPGLIAGGYMLIDRYIKRRKKKS